MKKLIILFIILAFGQVLAWEPYTFFTPNQEQLQGKNLHTIFVYKQHPKSGKFRSPEFLYKVLNVEPDGKIILFEEYNPLNYFTKNFKFINQYFVKILETETGDLSFYLLDSKIFSSSDSLAEGTANKPLRVIAKDAEIILRYNSAGMLTDVDRSSKGQFLPWYRLAYDTKGRLLQMEQSGENALTVNFFYSGAVLDKMEVHGRKEGSYQVTEFKYSKQGYATSFVNYLIENGQKSSKPFKDKFTNIKYYPNGLIKQYDHNGNTYSYEYNRPRQYKFDED